MIIGINFDFQDIKSEYHCDDKDGTFRPLKKINEGKMVEPFGPGSTGWEAHYGRSIEILDSENNKSSYTQINLHDLVIGCWYIGRGRNSNVGLWDGTHFMVIGYSWGDRVVKYEWHYNKEYGTFQPFKRIDEVEMIESSGPVPTG